MTTPASDPASGGRDRARDVGLLILRLGVGAAILQAGLIKALDFSATVGFMTDAGWRLPTLAALMVTAAETLGGIGLLFGVLTPLSGCAVFSAMLCAWAVMASGTVFWSDPFNLAFLIGFGAAALVLTGAGALSADAALLGRPAWPPRRAVALLALAVVAAVVTWVALYGVNPIHLTPPPA